MKTINRILTIVLVIVLIVGILGGGALFIRKFGRSGKYDKAMQYYESGDYESAASSFEELKGYKDSDHMYSISLSKYEIGIIRKASLGDSVIFGSFEQDNNSDKTEPLEWYVIAKDDKRALLISRYIIDCQQYYRSDVDADWSQSPIRNWLNDEFFESSFLDTEKERILSSIVAHKETEKRNKYEYEVTDKVFLLSVEEAKEYLLFYVGNRGGQPTAYCISKNEDKPISGWWLRDTYFRGKSADYVSLEGTFTKRPLFNSSNDLGGIRPSIWINIQD